MATLSAIYSSPTIDGAILGCISDAASGTIYAAIRSDRAWQDNQSDIDEIVAGYGGSVLWAASSAATVDPSFIAAALDANTDYYFALVQDDSGYSNVIQGQFTTADYIEQVQIGADVGEIAATAFANTNAGTVYVAAWSDLRDPIASEIIAGTGATDSASEAVSGQGIQSPVALSLGGGQPYSVGVVWSDGQDESSVYFKSSILALPTPAPGIVVYGSYIAPVLGTAQTSTTAITVGSTSTQTYVNSVVGHTHASTTAITVGSTSTQTYVNNPVSTAQSSTTTVLASNSAAQSFNNAAQAITQTSNTTIVLGNYAAQSFNNAAQAITQTSTTAVSVVNFAAQSFNNAAQAITQISTTAVSVVSFAAQSFNNAVQAITQTSTTAVSVVSFAAQSFNNATQSVSHASDTAITVGNSAAQSFRNIVQVISHDSLTVIGVVISASQTVNVQEIIYSNILYGEFTPPAA
jgi:hypothetical protein